MDGVLVVDKPPGVTSHDVVAVARRVLREKGIGHTGTLDPMATGVLPLACGRATRLVRFLTASDKDYDAVIRFGLVTDSYDVTGTAIAESPARPEPGAVEAALASLRGDYLQMPPPYSAKRVGGHRAYDLARSNRPVELAAVPVRVSRAEVTASTADTVTVSLTCSAGFYVRSFAHTLGERLGMGACLEQLRRTRSGGFTLADSVSWSIFTAPGASNGVEFSAVPMAKLLPHLPAVALSPAGRVDVSHGRLVPPAAYTLLNLPALSADESRARQADRRQGEVTDPSAAAWIRLFDQHGELVAMAQPANPHGALHPSVVLI